jgi:hypothetical protein
MDTLDYAAHSKTRRPGLLSIEWFWLMLVRQRPVSRSDRFLAQIGHLVFTSLLGGFFTAVVPEAEEKKPILKGCALASGAWLFTQALVRAVKVPILSQLEWDVRIVHLNLSLIYGLFLGSTLSFLKRNINFI